LTTNQRTALVSLARAVVAELELRKRVDDLAAAVAERDAAQNELRRANENLESKVAERAQELSSVNRSLENEVVARRIAEWRIRELAMHDALTQLPNRALLTDRLKQQLALARRQNVLVAFLFVDLDGFKAINDTHGHRAGDHLLKEIAQRLLGCVREGDIVVCLSGDEFVVALYGLASRRNAASIAKKILSASSDPINFEGETLTASASIGISVCPNDADEPAPLIQLADSAMYRAKREGRNAFRFYSQ
jgi:diguanylate cyclase (GGDEF)-like protein